MKSAIVAAALAALGAMSPAMAQAPSCPDTKAQPIMPTHMIPPYPALSQKLGEQGTTILMVDIGADGAPTAARVTKSSGSLRLDDAAATYVKDNWRWQSPTRQCRPVAFSTDVSIVWNLKGASPQGPPFTVIIAADSDFPKGAKEQGAHGSTVVAVIVGSDGNVNLSVANSSGFSDLDGAAFRKIGAMKFAPATVDGKPAPTVLFFRMDWGQPAAPAGKAP